MSIALPAWRIPRASLPATPSSAVPIVTKGTRPIWPAFVIIVGVPTALFAAEAALGLITV